MFNKKALKILSLVFGIISLVGCIFCLCLAITLPHSATYNTVFGTVRATRSGYFDMSFLTPIILLTMGAYIGFSIYGCIKCDGCKKEKVKEDTEAKKEEKKEEAPLIVEEKKEEESGV